MKLFFQNNVAYTRGALLALFAGLFILAACGGVNVAPTFIINNPPADSSCVTNPYGPTCTKQKEAAIELCRDAIAGGDDCADNTPESVVSCLTDPFSAACTTAQATENPFEGTEITIAKEQEKRQDTCLRSDTTALCETAVFSLCSANPFTQTRGDTPTNLCVDISGTAYADARAEACLASPDGTPVDSSCATNTLAEDTCETAPFGRTGCDNLDEIDGYRTTFCTVTDVFNPSCGDTDEYGATNAARDGFCSDTAAEGNSDCASRLTGICATGTGSNVFAALCGDNAEAETAACQSNSVSVGDSRCSSYETGICTTNGGTSPFAPLCGTNNVASQRIFCTTNRAHVGTTGNCADTISTFCGSPDSPADIYNDLCDVGYTSERLIYCRDTAPDGDTNCDDGNTATLCTTNGGTSPFSRLCGLNVANQRTFCENNRSHVGTTGNCPDTISSFCNDSANDIFDRLCSDDAGTYDVARGKQCVADGTTGGECGDENTAGKYIHDYCQDATNANNVTDCPDTYENANSAVTEVNVTDSLTGKALNSEGTALLTGADGTTGTAIISSGGAHADNDARSNFIAGGTADLDLGSVTTTNASTLTLGMLDNDSDANGGFAIAVGKFDSDNHSFYVGLLSNTALGAPLNDAMQGGIWSAKIRILTSIKDNHLLEADFKLNVDFATKSLKIVNVAGEDANINFDISGTRLAFFIDGKFTANGVIYGTVDFTGANNNGTLTGLIGQNGAVGIFKRNSDSSPYVGGFVAAKTDCTVTSFAADCTTTPDYDRQARLCNNHRTTSVANFNTNCRDNGEVTSRVCTIYGSYANLFNRALCPDAAGNSVKRARFCARYNYAYHTFGVYAPTGFDVGRDCAADPAVTKLVCRSSGQYAQPFNVNLCPNSDALRVELCSHRRAMENLGYDFNTYCTSSGITDLVCIPSGPYANPFNTNICPDSKSSNKEARVTACRDRTLPDGVNLLIDCARDSAITDLICADSGANANPFDSEICLGDQATAQTDFLDNCRANTAGGANCARYTDCVANPYMDGCDATYYKAERKDYTESLLTYCSNDRAGETAPVGAPSCATPLIQAVVCASSGTYANPLDTEVCPVSDVADIDMIQNEFTTTCYHARADLTEKPECNNIATCFMAGNLATPATSTDGRFACNSGGLFDVKELVICDGAVSGGNKPQDCVLGTITKACNANPFSEITNGKGIDCISDRSRDTARNELCFSAASVQYDCTLTQTRACLADPNGDYCPEDMANSPCVGDPFGFSCYDDNTYNSARLMACDTAPIAAEISSDTAFADKSTLAQNCLATIDEECSYDETEQFTNNFCKIGTLYDAERGRLCLYGYTPANAGDETVIPTECASNPGYAVAFCSELALEGNMECAGRKADICTTSNGTAPFAPLCGENLAVQMKFCTEGTMTIFDTRCASADGLTQTIAGTNNARKAACGGNEGESNRATDAQCADTVLYICGDLGTVFEPACLRANVTATYDVARGRACVEGTAPHGTNCGNEAGVDGTYVQAYCATSAGNTNVTNCPTAYATANNTAVREASLPEFTATGENKPLNSDGSGLATVIDAGGANADDDADANFITGGVSALVTGLTQTNEDTFRLNDLESRAYDQSGFAVAIAEQKYYVGFLSGTNMGRLLPSATAETILEWPAQLRVLRDTTFATAQDFTLLVELSGKTISVKTGSITGEVFSINDGKFTANGLLYGGITFGNDSATAGSLTGFIGRSGGIAIFKSNPATTANPNPVAYVGGFVTHTEVDCTREGTPFDIICAGNAVERAALATSCRNGELGINRGTPVCNQFINGVDGLTIAECIWNPYRTTDGCNTNPAFASERWNILHFCANLFTTFAAQCDILPDTQADHAANTDIARGQACAVGYFPAQFGTATMRVCGSETTAGSYLAEYCDTAAGQGDVGNCKIAYSVANPTLARVDVSWLGSRLRNSDDTDLATVIAEGAGKTANDNDANFIVGGADALVTGISTQANDDLLTLNGVGISEDTNSGFAVAIAEQKYYVGLLSGTNLGSVLPTADVEIFLDWPAKLRILRDTTFATAQDFTLRIELKDKTISVKSGTLDASVFAINDGKYGTYGLLYGTVTVGNAGAGTLTGLIGGKGAVGIFKSDVGSASDYVGGFVAASAELDCSADGTPFDVGCTNNAVARAALATSCRSGQGGSRHGTVACSQFINGVDGLSIAECIHRPYRTTNDCNINPAFAAERWNLLHFCVLLRTAPFTYQCDPLPDIQADYADNIRFTRGQICIERGEGFTPPRGVCGSETMAGSLIKDYCGTVMGQTDATNCAIAYVSYIEAYCASDDIGVATNIKLCPNGYARLNGDAAEVSWAEFDASGKNQPLNADGSGALNVFEAHVRRAHFRPTNFVKIAVGSTLPLGLTNKNKVITLTDTSDGFARVASGGSSKLYVGLLPGTSLGAPLRNATAQTATWNANLSVLFFNGTTFMQDSGTFTLQVNFGGDTGNTLAIMGDDPSVATLGAFSLTNAKFTRNGVIYGTVAFANYGAGTITGLIGTAGTVGIFKSDNSSFTGNQYVGGFVAEPTPADVTAIGFKAKALQNNGTDTLIVLDSGAPDTANADTVNFIEGGAVGTGFANATMKISLPINTGGGVAFAYGDSGTANNYHVGILADTNVGPALNNDVTGDWVGKIQAIVNGSDTTEQAITFNVNFGAKSFAIKDGTAPTFANIGAMTMDGHFTPEGVIYGSVYFGGANTNTGMLTGLIGQNALVGAFAGNSGVGNNPYVGGFIANKPTQ